MASTAAVGQRFNIVAVGQAGRLAYEAVLLAASLRATNPDFQGRLFIAQPRPGPLWQTDPTIKDPDVLDLLAGFGADILPFDNQVFGESYPYGNKIECLTALPDEPFLFVDTDTLFTGRLSSVGFDFARPSASMKRENTWPEPGLYGPGYNEIWKSLYDRFGLDFASSLDTNQPDEYWQRYLYFNAGWFFFQSPQAFGARFTDYARDIAENRPRELVVQSLDPWLDQIALPLVIHSLGGGRPGPELTGLDGDVTCHWRLMPLFYARESDLAVKVMEEVLAPNAVKKVLKNHAPFKRMVYQGKGAEVRRMFDRENLPRKEQMIRNRIKREKLWVR
tara:strand:+ start:1918 stop:2919 length:1002 start_codon:yes stop_codon:yes gene_type:complete